MDGDGSTLIAHLGLLKTGLGNRVAVVVIVVLLLLCCCCCCCFTSTVNSYGHVRRSVNLTTPLLDRLLRGKPVVCEHTASN